ncbi:MarR family winged helix-turn-helix transcriptional regulator [Pseudonocardia oroxyli]|uniref:Transcriptional regulator, MarR family n=1 Tax=Pseudonocardia oroxyli TaxID=366584 RepID=A0A1G7JL53_PSEOR|nr:MarR family transcriptional regulator [Pseudonocardia oroxyli]SDF25670.1 transcriptional regulator, MarR family [Pseudonocardia oroxyli]
MISTSTAADLIEVMRDVVALSRAARQAPEGEPGGPCAVHHAQAGVLVLLHEEGEQRLGRLAGSLELDASVISRRVAVLEESGLVVRRPDPADRRAQLVALTDEGAEALRCYRTARAEEVAAALAEREDADVAVLVAGLRGLLSDLSRVPAPRHRTPVG